MLGIRDDLEHDDRVIEVRPGGRRRIDRVLAADYVRDLERLTLPELRARRDEAAQEETDLSYLRRLLHARIDIVRAEQRRRSSGGAGDVVAQLAEILADDAVGTAGRHQSLEPSRVGERRRLTEALISDAGLSDVASLSDDALERSLAAFGEEEQSVSGRRREVQVVVDTLNSEIAGRYAHGAASVDDLLAAERDG